MKATQAWVFVTLIGSFIIYGTHFLRYPKRDDHYEFSALIWLKFSGYIEMDVHGRPKDPIMGLGNLFRPLASCLGIRTGQNRSRTEPRVLPSHAFKAAKRLMWLPISVSQLLHRFCVTLIVLATVYMIVVTPVTICRIGRQLNWTPPFWLYTLSGVCFGSSGKPIVADAQSTVSYSSDLSRHFRRNFIHLH
jgi:hypothetical protein